MKQDGDKWRRVVPSPRPVRIFEIHAMRWLLERGAIVICAGGGGIPTVYEKGEDSQLRGVEAVIDKDLASSLLACDLEADLFVMATDVDAVYADWGTPSQRNFDRVTPEELASERLPGRVDGPEGPGGREFVEVTGNRAVIGSLEQIDGLLAGTAGTSVVPGVMA